MTKGSAACQGRRHHLRRINGVVGESALCPKQAVLDGRPHFTSPGQDCRADDARTCCSFR